MSRLRDRRGTDYASNGADCAIGLNYLGESMSCTILQTGIVLFSPTRDMATYYMAKRRHLRIPASLFITIFVSGLSDSEAWVLISFLTKLHQFHNWLLTSEGTLLQHFETGMECRVQTVSSMAAFDIVASSVSGNFVNFGAHPMLTRGLHLWAGRQRWRLQGRNFTSLSLGGAILKEL